MRTVADLVGTFDVRRLAYCVGFPFARGGSTSLATFGRAASASSRGQSRSYERGRELNV
jgi:hypothetical protein